MTIAAAWNPRQKKLRELLGREDAFVEARGLCLELHRQAHCSEMTEQAGGETLADGLWNGLAGRDLAVMPKAGDRTIAWNLWHLARIEDLTMNILVADAPQVWNEAWGQRLGTRITDTGNAMDEDGIMALSRELDGEALRAYRNAVGRRSRAVVAALTPGDLRRKVHPEGLRRVRAEGGVTDHPDSAWLLDFWGGKTVAGLLLMPLTRHQLVHLNDCLRLKAALRTRKSFHRA